MNQTIAKPNPSVVKFSNRATIPEVPLKLNHHQDSSKGIKYKNYTPRITSNRTNGSKHIITSHEASLRNAFKLFENPNDKLISKDELIGFLQEINSESKDLGSNQIIEKLKKMPSKLSFDNFSDLFRLDPLSFNNIEDTKAVFDVLDYNKSGYISIQNLKEINNQLGKMKSGNQLIEMIRIADSDGDWLVNLEDLHRVLRKSNASH